MEGDAEKSVKNSHLLVIICMRLLEKIDLIDLMSWTLIKNWLEITYKMFA